MPLSPTAVRVAVQEIINIQVCQTGIRVILQAVTRIHRLPLELFVQLLNGRPERRPSLSRRKQGCATVSIHTTAGRVPHPTHHVVSCSRDAPVTTLCGLAPRLLEHRPEWGEEDRVKSTVPGQILHRSVRCTAIRPLLLHRAVQKLVRQVKRVQSLAVAASPLETVLSSFITDVKGTGRREV
jgi:hypothetical protein